MRTSYYFRFENGKVALNAGIEQATINEQAAEIDAEMAIERYYEGGWDSTGQYSYDPFEVRS